jgi:hypothetical protein
MKMWWRGGSASCRNSPAAQVRIDEGEPRLSPFQTLLATKRALGVTSGCRQYAAALHRLLLQSMTFDSLPGATSSHGQARHRDSGGGRNLFESRLSSARDRRLMRPAITPRLAALLMPDASPSSLRSTLEMTVAVSGCQDGDEIPSSTIGQ